VLPRGLTLCAVLTFAACASSPLAPTASATAAPLPADRITFVDASGAPVPNLAVAIDGTVHTTDLSGRLPVSVRAGASLSTAPVSTLERRTIAPRGGFVTLWPDTTAVPQADTWSMVYKDAPEQVLTRVAARRVSLQPATALRSDETALAVLAEAASRMTAATGVPYTVDATTPLGAIAFRVGLDPRLPPDIMAHTDVHSRDAVIDGGTVRFRTTESARRLNTVLHELGHTFGVLGHSAYPGNVMYAEAGTAERFSAQEIVTLRMIQRRPPGNRFPDDDSSLAARASLGVTSSVACQGR
jgi:hypothetical protein